MHTRRCCSRAGAARMRARSRRRNRAPSRSAGDGCNAAVKCRRCPVIDTCRWARPRAAAFRTQHIDQIAGAAAPGNRAGGIGRMRSAGRERVDRSGLIGLLGLMRGVSAGGTRISRCGAGEDWKRDSRWWKGVIVKGFFKNVGRLTKLIRSSGL